MNLQFLREFLLLSETLNYMEASSRLYIAQSTLSKHIQQLEKSLDVPLFIRSSHRVELTNYGQLLLPYARKLLSTQAAFKKALYSEKERQKGQFVLGTIPSMSQYAITDLIRYFNQEYPSHLIKVIEDDSYLLLKKLLNHQCELAFIRRQVLTSLEENLLLFYPYVEDHLVAILPWSHPYAYEDQVSLTSLCQDTFILLEEHTYLYKLIIETAEGLGFYPKVAFDCHRIDTIIDLVRQGMGISILTNRHVQEEHYKKDSEQSPFAIVKLIPNLQTSIVLCTCKNRILSSSAQLFVDYFLKSSHQSL